jgi:uncharacterized BrkB/YihY/UPF0761 family membrane protein
VEGQAVVDAEQGDAASSAPGKPSWVKTVVTVQRRYGEVGGDASSKAIAFSMFASVLPLLLVGIAVIGFVSHSRANFADDAIAKLGLTGSSADSFKQAMTASENNRAATSIVGFVTLLWTGLGLVKSIKRGGDRAWQLAGGAVSGVARTFVWLVGLAVLSGAVVASSAFIRFLPAVLAPLLLLSGLVVGICLFWWTGWILTEVRLPARSHRPGAIVCGALFFVITTFGTTYLSGQIAKSSAAFGVIGGIIAVLAWFALIGRLFVYSAVINVVMHERAYGTTTATMSIPAMPATLARPAPAPPFDGTRGGLIRPSARRPSGLKRLAARFASHRSPQQP